jgi:predicted lipid-binding transport protein (Tim44 family)
VGMVATSMDADARRLGGGRPAGMQRQMPAKQPAATPNQAPTNAAQPGNAAAPMQGAAPQPGKRNWLGPVAGIAAGLGIAALMSHFGMGEAMGNMLTMALVAMVAMFAITWLMRRFKGATPAAGGQLAGAGAPYNPQPEPMQRQAAEPAFGSVGAAALPAAPAGNLSAVPAGFDVEGFQRVAKMIFIRLQAANDAGKVDDLRKFTTPELFASLRLDLQERGQAANQTDVMQLDAELVDTAKENGQWVASVRFHGLIREEVNQGAQPFNELWHLVKPLEGNQDWAIAGITPLDA